MKIDEHGKIEKFTPKYGLEKLCRKEGVTSTEMMKRILDNLPISISDEIRKKIQERIEDVKICADVDASVVEKNATKALNTLSINANPDKTENCVAVSSMLIFLRRIVKPPGFEELRMKIKEALDSADYNGVSFGSEI